MKMACEKLLQPLHDVYLSLAIHFSSSFLLWLIIVITLHEDSEQFSFECRYYPRMQWFA